MTVSVKKNMRNHQQSMKQLARKKSFSFLCPFHIFHETLQKRLKRGNNGNQVLQKTSFLYKTQHKILTRKGNSQAKDFL